MLACLSQFIWLRLAYLRLPQEEGGQRGTGPMSSLTLLRRPEFEKVSEDVLDFIVKQEVPVPETREENRSELAGSASQPSLGLGQSSPLASCSAAVLRPQALARRRWTLDLTTAHEEDVSSPKWAKPVARRASNRLVMDEADDCDRSFEEICGRLQGLVDQTVMRTLKFFSRIRECHKQEPTVLLEPQNFKHLTSASYMVATVNYRLSKWLHQLDPHSNVKPSKPVESQHLERTVDELLRDINFMLSRMAVLASALVPKLRKIIGDARASKANRLQNAYNPFGAGDPGFCNPERMAQQQGIRDVHELEGMISHLERILEVSHALAFRPAPSKVRITATILLASQRFKKLPEQQ